MSEKIVFADDKGMVYLLCPFCGEGSKRPLEQFPYIHKPVTISCSCGNTYDVQIDARKTFRKKTSLEGLYAKLVSPGDFERMTVVNLTLGGCGLLASNEPALNQGDWIKLVFKLDDAKRTEIKRNAVVRRVTGNYIGCQFTVATAYDPDIGFYLRME
ncbi:MAG: hypothetical protein A2X95_05000 [Syntrophobacterales bacterium GWF2_56_9]|nr:MAG: hypothetical protein A2X95_05000 [Syntrophobacterales bacterium GWF2_56_9]